MDTCRFEATCPRCQAMVWWQADAIRPYGFTIECTCTRRTRRADAAPTTLDRKMGSS